MFDIAFSEIVVIAVVALIVIGPERLPKVARTLGHMFRALLYGSYRKPRELLWIVGCFIYLALMAEAFFGYLLPWAARPSSSRKWMPRHRLPWRLRSSTLQRACRSPARSGR